MPEKTLELSIQKYEQKTKTGPNKPLRQMLAFLEPNSDQLSLSSSHKQSFVERTMQELPQFKKP